MSVRQLPRGCKINLSVILARRLPAFWTWENFGSFWPSLRNLVHTFDPVPATQAGVTTDVPSADRQTETIFEIDFASATHFVTKVLCCWKSGVIIRCRKYPTICDFAQRMFRELFRGGAALLQYQQTTILSWLTSIALNLPALLEDVYWYTKQNEVIGDFQFWWCSILSHRSFLNNR